MTTTTTTTTMMMMNKSNNNNNNTSSSSPSSSSSWKRRRRRAITTTTTHHHHYRHHHHIKSISESLYDIHVWGWKRCSCWMKTTWTNNPGGKGKGIWYHPVKAHRWAERSTLCLPTAKRKMPKIQYFQKNDHLQGTRLGNVAFCNAVHIILLVVVCVSIVFRVLCAENLIMNIQLLREIGSKRTVEFNNRACGLNYITMFH